MGRTAEKIGHYSPRSNRSATRRDAKQEAASARRRDEKQALKVDREPRKTPFRGYAD